MKLYKHKAICELCQNQEYDGTWIRWFGADDFHYICFRCIGIVWDMTKEELEKM